MSSAAVATAVETPGGRPQEQIELSIVLPCLNEAETLQACLHTAQTALQQSAVQGEIIVADNGSSDGSPEIASRNGARLIHVELKGYGSAIMGGIGAAKGKYLLIADSDGQHDLSQLPQFLGQLRAGADIVVGNRFRGKRIPGATPFLHFYFGTPVLSALGKLLFRSPVDDFNCGMRALRSDVCRQLNLRTTGMEFASEMIVKATLLRLKIVELPTTVFPHGRSRPAHLRTWVDGWRHLRFLLLYSPRWLFLYPGSFMLVAGLAGMLRLSWSDFHSPLFTLGINTLLVSAFAVVIGFQSVAFAVCSNVFAATEGLTPVNPRVERVFEIITLEVAIVAGFLLILCGLLFGGYMFSQSAALPESLRDPVRLLRGILPAILSMTLGVQLLLTGFFLSILGLHRRS